MLILFFIMCVMKLVVVIIILVVLYFIELWGIFGEDSLFDMKFNIFLIIFVVVGGFVLFIMKVCGLFYLK